MQHENDDVTSFVFFIWSRAATKSSEDDLLNMGTIHHVPEKSEGHVNRRARRFGLVCEFADKVKTRQTQTRDGSSG